MPFDSYRHLDVITRQIMKAWVAREQAQPIPWTPLPRPLHECRVALVSSAAIAVHGDKPFDQEGERRNPWWGDPTFRVVPHGVTGADVELYHLHIDPRFGKEDLDVVLPAHRLDELAAEGVVGQAAPEHYSFMGYILKPKELVETTAPAIAARMKAAAVDAALLVPV